MLNVLRSSPPVELSPQLRQLRANVRAFLMLASIAELHTEYALSLERNDKWRAAFVMELIEQWQADNPVVPAIDSMGS